jgi:hypothetical protein
MNYPILNNKLAAFCRQHLAQIGIIDVGYSRWNPITDEHIFICSLEQFVTDVYYPMNCDKVAAEMLEDGAFPVDDDHPIKIEYDKIKGVPCKEQIITNRTSTGFDEFVVTSKERLSVDEIAYLRRKMAAIVYMFRDAEGHPIRNLDAVKRQFGMATTQIPAEHNLYYDFDGIVLNVDELKALANAYLYNRASAIHCPVIASVKIKLGDPNMSTPTMFSLLEARHVIPALRGVS